jgi:hypothetical protein
MTKKKLYEVLIRKSMIIAVKMQDIHYPNTKIVSMQEIDLLIVFMRK